ncbi:hypothetical protein CLOM_g609 [Closterium sp. NIES-68]|nr:hypothetical protein CLOM_g609 [Closterium sp. NIES-68]GJP57592.1 hypothetical protein CLOP_g21005 [Closterium sp. NIES-67]
MAPDFRAVARWGERLAHALQRFSKRLPRFRREAAQSGDGPADADARPPSPESSAQAASAANGSGGKVPRGGGKAGPGKVTTKGKVQPWVVLQRQWLTIFLVAWLLGGLALATWTVLYSHSALQEERYSSLLTWCGERARSLVHQFRSSSDHAMVFTGLVDVFGEAADGNAWGYGSCITRESFQAYVNETSYARPWVSAITWIVFVKHSQRAEFERKFGITIKSQSTKGPSPPRDWYAVFLYISEGSRTNNSDCCYDGRQYSRFKDAIEHGLKTHNISITPTFTLVANGNRGLGLGFPVLKNSTEGKQDMKGMIGAVIDMQALIDFLLKKLLSASAPFKLQLFDVTNRTAPIPMYDSERTDGFSTLPDQTVAPASDELLQPTRFRHVEPIDLRDPSRQYELWCRYTENDTVAWGWSSLSWGVLLLVVFILVFYILLTMGRQNAAMRRNYRRMEALKARAEAADRAKSNFLATVSHEIRTPMNGVLGMLDFLLDSKLDAQQQEHARMAKACGQTLVSLLNDVLDLAKVEADRLELEHLPFNLRSSVDDILDIFRTKSQDLGLELAALVDPNVPEVVVGDRIRLRQVVVNLIGNSIKFTQRGHIFVHISAPFAAMPVPSSLPSPLTLRSRFNTLAASAPPASAALAARKLTAGDGWGLHSAEVQLACSPLRSTGPISASLAAIGRSISRGYQTLSGRPTSLVYGPGGAAGAGLGQPSCSTGDLVGCFPALLQPGYSQMEDGVSVGIQEGGMEEVENGAGGKGGEEEIMVGEGEDGEEGKEVEKREDAITLLITCEDTGAGIPLSSQSKIFQPFTQAESSTARTHGGTGIGLTISKRLVKLMGGDMTFVSEPGVGTTFVLTVNLGLMPPRVPRSVPTALPADLLPMLDDDPDAAAMIEKFLNRAVLVVDGLQVRQRVASSVLSRLGITPIPATDAASVPAIATRGFLRGPPLPGSTTFEDDIRPWDAIFVDKDAFGPKTGFQVARAIQEAFAAVEKGAGERGVGETIKEEVEEAAASAAAGAAAAAGANGTSGGGGCGSSKVRKQPPLILVACRLEAEEKSEVEACGFEERLLKPLRKSIVAACLVQVLGIMTTSRSSNTQKQQRRKAMQALIGGRRILVVDDNVVNQKVAMRMLQRYGVLCEAVDSGMAALQAVQDAEGRGQPFDAVFMDVQMPGMDGYETTRSIRRRERENGAAAIPIFAMTADVISGSRTRCEEAGMDGFVPKPIDEEQLHATLWNCFGRA